MKSMLRFGNYEIFGSIGVYGALAFLFSTISLILPQTYIVGNPLAVSGVTPEHVVGHILWGLVAGIATFSFRYAILSGVLPIVLDFDHWLQFLDLEMIPRMAHSIPFGIVAFTVLFVLFWRKDLRIPAVALGAVFAHISFDIFLGGTSKFPLFAPIITDTVTLSGPAWIYFEVLAVVIIFVFSVLQRRKKIRVFQ